MITTFTRTPGAAALILVLASVPRVPGPRIDLDPPVKAAPIIPVHPVDPVEFGDVVATPPPPGAVVLFDGTDASAWRSARHANQAAAWRVADGTLEVVRGAGDIISRRAFGDALVHVEWRAPPGGAGQMAGNSGIKVQERYEVQVLSEPLPGAATMLDGAGAIYAFARPAVNATRGPGRWQSYDILFKAARWLDDRKTADARMTVHWNGVLVHDDVALPRGTGGAPRPEAPPPLGILLQDHASAAEEPVRYRNVWVLEAPGLRAVTTDATGRVGEALTVPGPEVQRGGVVAFTVEPPLPAGLSIDGDTGRITGAPRQHAPRATYRVRARNAAGTAETVLTLAVDA